ncbi:hypothetical protein VTJ04DRAFT_2393 [Mycothermus thermophilus]|uniref:uncharacterized protein n=1 Tax=Humicola insolens TaxID=85995 RepID=UPI003743E0C8
METCTGGHHDRGQGRKCAGSRCSDVQILQNQNTNALLALRGKCQSPAAQMKNALVIQSHPSIALHKIRRRSAGMVI